MRSLKGKLLVATPPLVDPNFDRTVVLMLEHSDDGALGVVLNRPTAEDVREILPDWATVVSGHPYVFEGGPVEPEAIIGLAWVDGEPDGNWAAVGSNLGTVDLSADPLDLADRIQHLRLFRGYSGWGPAQLEDEIDLSAWIVVDADRDDAFTSDPEGLWRAVLRRQGGTLARIGEFYPDDVTAN